MNQNIKNINQMFLITVLVSLAASFMPLGRLFPDYASRILFSEIILAAPGAVYLIAGHRNYARAVRLKPIRLGTFFWLILFTVCVMPVMSMVNAISMLFVENTTTSMMSTVTTEHSYLLSMLLIALLPCVFEESVYRGLFYNEYRKAAPAAGMFLSALLFGLMHGNLNQFSYAFLMGIIFALVIEATDSILSSMIMHFLINGFSVTVMSLYPKLTAYLARMYEEAKAAGDTNLSEQLEPFANTGAEGGNLLEESLKMASNTDTLAGVIRSFLPAALIGGIAAVIVYRVMAKGEGRLEYVDSLFFRKKKKNQRISENAAEPVPALQGTAEYEEQIKLQNREISAVPKGNERAEKRRWGLITAPLLAAILICFSLMILNEFL